MPGQNKRSIGYNSSLPASISKVKTSFEKYEYILKFAIGPTLASPGPILLNVAAMAVKLVSKSKLLSDSKNIEIV